MKFKDIEQFTRMPDYYINVSLDYLKKKVDDDVDELGLQLCPDFQRGYVWTESQQIAYIEYILKGGRSGRDLYFNCPGWHSGEIGDYVCVDGLQRITALLRFLNDETPAFGSLYSEYEDRLRMHYNVIWHVNDLKTRKEVLSWYLEMNSGGTPHTKEELERVARMCEEAI
jgi:uncharacterized protein with ParB-like and HNH nuclease domain